MPATDRPNPSPSADSGQDVVRPKSMLGLVVVGTLIGHLGGGVALLIGASVWQALGVLSLTGMVAILGLALRRRRCERQAREKAGNDSILA